MNRVLADLWMRLPTPGKIAMLFIISGLFGKWAVDDFRRSRRSAITWVFAVASVLGFLLAAGAAFAPSN